MKEIKAYKCEYCGKLYQRNARGGLQIREKI